MLLTPDSPDYPRALKLLGTPPPLTLSRALPRGNLVAIVGTRVPTEGARRFAFELARTIVRAGGVVVSGGALGIDAAAHEGALSVPGGRTIAVVATGKDHVFPSEHDELYAKIAASPGAMVWPFPDDYKVRQGSFHRRNGVLVSLSAALVIVQAGAKSGALNAAAAARKLGRRIWVVPQAPWNADGFEGSLAELERGARPLVSVAKFIKAEEMDQKTLSLGFHELAPPVAEIDSRPPEGAEARLLAVMDREPRHRDELAETAGLTAAQVTTALLTLTLENVVEEGPLGFFSRVGK